MMNEKLIEKKLAKGVSERGGLALKFASPYFTGMPDRLALMPGGKVFFAELKSTGEKLKPRQEAVKRQLERLGFQVSVIDDQESLAGFLNRLI